MTPDEYRVKWGLAPDYPMLLQNYAARRSEFAKEDRIGARHQPAVAARQEIVLKSPRSAPDGALSNISAYFPAFQM